jgi:hypothetical protein
VSSLSIRLEAVLQAQPAAPWAAIDRFALPSIFTSIYAKSR